MAVTTEDGKAVEAIVGKPAEDGIAPVEAIAPAEATTPVEAIVSEDTMAITTENGKSVNAVIGEPAECGIAPIVVPKPEAPEEKPHVKPAIDPVIEHPDPAREEVPAQFSPVGKKINEPTPSPVGKKSEERAVVPAASEPLQEKEAPTVPEEAASPSPEPPQAPEEKLPTALEPTPAPTLARTRTIHKVRAITIPKFPIKMLVGKEIAAATIFLVTEKAKGKDVSQQIQALMDSG
jgi:hypothetical protein